MNFEDCGLKFGGRGLGFCEKSESESDMEPLFLELGRNV